MYELMDGQEKYNTEIVEKNKSLNPIYPEIYKN